MIYHNRRTPPQHTWKGGPSLWDPKIGKDPLPVTQKRLQRHPLLSSNMAGKAPKLNVRRIMAKWSLIWKLWVEAFPQSHVVEGWEGYQLFGVQNRRVTSPNLSNIISGRVIRSHFWQRTIFVSLYIHEKASFWYGDGSEAMNYPINWLSPFLWVVNHHQKLGWFMTLLYPHYFTGCPDFGGSLSVKTPQS